MLQRLVVDFSAKFTGKLQLRDNMRCCKITNCQACNKTQRHRWYCVVEKTKDHSLTLEQCGKTAQDLHNERCISADWQLTIFGMLTTVITVGTRLQWRRRSQTVIIEMSYFAHRRLAWLLRCTLWIVDQYCGRHNWCALNT